MDSQAVFQLAFRFFTSKPVVVEPSAAQVSSDGGLLPFRYGYGYGVDTGDTGSTLDS